MEFLNPNLATLEATSAALEPILDDLVFVGGTIVGLLVDDPGAGPVRATVDVDVVAQVGGIKGYQWATSTMTKMGFQPDSREGAPICRWVKGDLLVDLVGTEDAPLWSTNPWYEEGFRTRIQAVLPESRRSISILAAPVFLLTKWVAYQNRGDGCMTGSRDIEDILNVLDGRVGLREEAGQSSPEVQAGLSAMGRSLFDSQQFCEHCLESMGDRQEYVRGVLEGFL